MNSYTFIFLAVEAGADYIECDLQFTKDQGIALVNLTIASFTQMSATLKIG